MSTKKIFPKINKSVTQFISEEDGSVTKVQFAKVLVGAALIGTIGHSITSQVQAGHTSYDYGIASGHVSVAGINQQTSGRMDRKANGHVNGTPLGGHLNAAHINQPGYGVAHASHGAHGSCGSGHW